MLFRSIPNIKAKIDRITNNIGKEDKKDLLISDLLLVRNEIQKLGKEDPNLAFAEVQKLTADKITPEVIKNAKKYMLGVNKHYVRMYNSANDRKDNKVRSLQSTSEAKAEFTKLKNDYENSSLSDLVTNKNDLKFILELDDQLVQRTNPIYLDPEHNIRAHFYAPQKKVFGTYIDTFWANMFVLWLMSIVLMITLYFDVFKGILDGLGNLPGKFQKKH